MKYRIITAKALTRKMKTRIFLRWFFYALVLLFFYSLMCCGAFKTWQPYLIIPLAAAVSMYEQEFSSSVFGIFCGLLLDMATGSLFGYHALVMMPLCLLTALLSRNLIKVNFINHLIVSVLTCGLLLMFTYIFQYVIWSRPNSEIVLLRVMLPSLAATAVMSAPVYFLTRLIAVKLGHGETKQLDEAANEAADDEKQKV